MTTPNERFLSEAGCRELLLRMTQMCTGGGELALRVQSKWTGNIRWARNQVISAGETTDHRLFLTRIVRGVAGRATVNSLDEDVLREGIRQAEFLLRYQQSRPIQMPWPRHTERYVRPVLWSDATFHVDAAARGALQRQVVQPSIAAGLLEAGYLEIAAIGNGVLNTSGLFAYIPQTRAEYSVTVRNDRGTGSGWAGTENVDWRKIDPVALSGIALDKCRRSADPVALEPGRYTVILEPQAVAELMRPLVESLARSPSELFNWTWRDKVTPPDPILGGRARFGEPVLDARITILADPMDPEGPFLPFTDDGEPTRRVTWIDRGVLRALEYGRGYALGTLNQEDPLPNTLAFRMDGGSATTASMIASTERGLLITRLVDVRPISRDDPTLLCQGRTGDGVWLIERGKITGPVKNFRFRESPLYVFNNLEALGPAVHVLMDQPTIAPTAKVRDFSLTSLADAI